VSFKNITVGTKYEAEWKKSKAEKFQEEIEDYSSFSTGSRPPADK
jgi:hypothetical protein